jgi:hypothetical protein
MPDAHTVAPGLHRFDQLLGRVVGSPMADAGLQVAVRRAAAGVIVKDVAPDIVSEGLRAI